MAKSSVLLSFSFHFSPKLSTIALLIIIIVKLAGLSSAARYIGAWLTLLSHYSTGFKFSKRFFAGYKLTRQGQHTSFRTKHERSLLAGLPKASPPSRQFQWKTW
ncbi:hypothetical protein MA16_Dca009198 [Dendrobium catenatum]|uniref:Uncharacterized protein n=1 Tax=Dendrobium catenatum TaxID=906689 RepID=A0A2I0VR30_9ASPA|nr:hypothetical protein MA16_Dca009198 [Dendrobium catenatum]